MYGRADTCAREGYAFNPDGELLLLEHAKSWTKGYESAPPPGVPTTCYGISNVETRSRWKYDSFADKLGTAVAHLPGDGTVPITSAIGPCKRWQESQTPEAVVGYIEQSLPSAEGKANFHKEMLSDTKFVTMLLKLIRDATTHSKLPDAS